MSEKGYIKYHCNWIVDGPLPESEIRTLNRWRAILYGLRLIGSYEDGVGYGNISERIEGSSYFIITGSATGTLPVLDGRHYTRVLAYDFDNNSLTCKGPIKASSEAMTHAAIYATDLQINGVIHVHSLSLWQELLNKLPTTAEKVEYGTPEIAAEMVRILKQRGAREQGIIIMGGHKEGIITFGKTLHSAGEILRRYTVIPG